ncbi:uncharacterized protein EV420DRAFT_516295 [Desarmillaria tabescens]|uniref:Transmembrane protein n=1 Tax=Armillaria tabescens TaxID=1929756 RepID=A0AA39KCD9_ARMTA|nr:uncharacterized protein EV420DRAFT_516295 [Desarmillaria tabescens]KAK0457271.1 hypothetical protein EV420DRAFT_516295 [Desarmillaria tabescens]
MGQLSAAYPTPTPSFSPPSWTCTIPRGHCLSHRQATILPLRLLTYAVVRLLAAPIDGHTPLKAHVQATPTKCLRIILALVTVLAFLVWHLGSDYTNTRRTDFQDKMHHRDDAERARRIRDEDMQRNLVHQQEDEERRRAHEVEDDRRSGVRKREERIIHAGLVAVAHREEAAC